MTKGELEISVVGSKIPWKNVIFRVGDVGQGPGLNNLWRNENKSQRENSPSQPSSSGHKFTKSSQETEFAKHLFFAAFR